MGGIVTVFMKILKHVSAIYAFILSEMLLDLKALSVFSFL